MRRKLDHFTPSPYFAWAVHIDGLRERHDESVGREGVFDKAVDGDLGGEAARVPGHHELDVLQHRHPEDGPRRARLPERRPRVDAMMISPAYAYEKAPDQEHFLGVTQTSELFREAFAEGRPRKLAAQPHAALPRLPGGQGRLPVHRLGDPELLGLRLAEALLPDERRLRLDVPGARRDHRLGALRPWQRPAVPQLHGPLRLRAVGGHGHHHVAAPVGARALERGRCTCST